MLDNFGDIPYNITRRRGKRLEKMTRVCWNWQTGTFEGRVLIRRTGSSPVTRTTFEKINMQMWRNGRRASFRCQCSQGRVGSSPTICTKNPECDSVRDFYLFLIRFSLFIISSVFTGFLEGIGNSEDGRSIVYRLCGASRSKTVIKGHQMVSFYYSLKPFLTFESEGIR